MNARLVGLVVAVALAIGGTAVAPRQAQAQVVTPYLVAMLSGPVSDGASVILLKKRENFVSAQTVLIACAAGFGAGVIASFLPAVFTLAGTGVMGVVDWAKAAIYPIYGCVVSGVGGFGGAMTEYSISSVKAGVAGPAS